MDKQNNTPPPWSEAPPWAKYRAQDEDGAWFFYKKNPYATSIDVEWRTNDISDNGCVLAKWCTPNPNWRDTLEKRPENE